MADGATDNIVRNFHQILLWPLQLVSSNDDGQVQTHWENLIPEGGASVWRELDDEFTDDPKEFQERHYREFVSFLPHVQRFLYGERASRSGKAGYGESPIRVFRRYDARRVRMTFPGDPTPVELEIVHIDLYFFYDVDVTILALEVRADNLPLKRAQEVMHRLGRAYPAGWEADGRAANCPEKVEWLDGEGRVLSMSDYEKREKYLASVCSHQATTIASHWEFLLAPMVLNQRDASGPMRYRLLEYYRMPIMAFLAMDNPTALSRADWSRMALAAAPGEDLPLATGFMHDFDHRFAYDRFYDPHRDGWTNTRLLCSGHTFVAVGPADKALFTDKERGFLAQFRHQIFNLGLIAHFHRAALLMLSDRIVTTVSRLDINNQAAVSRFRKDIRNTLEVFLRFTHRYYFSDVSDQAMLRDLFRMWTGHLGTAGLYSELREEIQDMSAYLETDMLRRQAVTILQLTVATLFSLVGTVTTGFLGMNLFNHAEMSGPERFGIFLMVFIPTTCLTLYTVMKSQRLARFLDALANEKVAWKSKLAILADVWRKRTPLN